MRSVLGAQAWEFRGEGTGQEGRWTLWLHQHKQHEKVTASKQQSWDSNGSLEGSGTLARRQSWARQPAAAGVDLLATDLGQETKVTSTSSGGTRKYVIMI
jgi:hypothetical protein